jgi:hypothetical protein
LRIPQTGRQKDNLVILEITQKAKGKPFHGAAGLWGFAPLVLSGKTPPHTKRHALKKPSEDTAKAKNQPMSWKGKRGKSTRNVT